MRADLVGGAALAAAAAAGAVAAQTVPARFGRAGALTVTAGVAVLVGRDVIMIRGGALPRLRPLPAGLLVAEPAVGLLSLALGIPTSYGARPTGRGSAARLARALASATFAIHTLREAIFLSPGRGRPGAPGAP